MIPFDLPLWSVLTFLFVLGATLGRWINVVAERLPYRLRFADQWRACFDAVTKRDVVAAGLPILGPLGRGGALVFGSKRRGRRASLAEFGNGALLAILYYFEIPLDAASGFAASSVAIPSPFGPTPETGAAFPSTVVLLHVRFLLHAILVEALLAASLVDLDTKLIPSITTDPFTVLGIVLSFALGWVHLAAVWYQDLSIVRLFVDPGGSAGTMPFPFNGPDGVPTWLLEHPHWHGLLASIAGVVVGGGVVWFVRVAGGWAIGREAMGQGDVYLMMTIGAFLGWQAALVVFFIAPICALAVVAVQWIVVNEGEIPYGPYLSLAAYVVLLGWNRIHPSVDQIFALGPVLSLFAAMMGLMLVVVLGFMRMVKSVLGIGQWDETDAGEWTPADQNHYLAGENVDDRQGRWRTDRWPGVSAGRGRSHEERWRDGG